MRELVGPELAPHLDAGELLREFFQLPHGAEYRALLNAARGWQLEAGDTLLADSRSAGVAVVLSGRAGSGSTPSPDGPERQVFGQWRALQGLPPDEAITALEPTVLLECHLELFKRLLRLRASRFKSAFYLPLVQELPPIADTPAAVLETVVKEAVFSLVPAGAAIVREGDYESTMAFLLEGEASALRGTEVLATLRRGDFFGEIAVITYGARTATVKAQDDCLVMFCERNPVSTLRKKSKTFKELMDRRFRERAMLGELEKNRLLRGLQREELQALAERATLETYDPYEPVFFQGDEANSLYLILNGTLTVVRESPSGAVPMNWMRPGETVGEMALLPETSGADRRGATVTALQRVDAICIPEPVVREMLERYPAAKARLEDTVRDYLRLDRDEAALARRSAAIGWMLDTQHVAGQAVLAVDMQDCIRCGNCVTACESVHNDGRNRFFWNTMRQSEDVLPDVRLSHSCQHCEFPLCMVPCPTQCISRNPTTGAVFIDHSNCIQCGKCADPSQGCPYGSIQIVPAEEVDRSASIPLFDKLLRRLRGAGESAPAGREKSGPRYPVKCDLCEGLPFQACVQHCPTGAVFRIHGAERFAEALQHPPASAETAPAPATAPLSLRVGFAHPPVAGKPGELEITISRSGDGVPLHYRVPEAGVSELKFNYYLLAPDTVRIGKGGALQQLVVTKQQPEGSLAYALTFSKAGEMELTLCLYQGGLFLGRVPVPVSVAPTAPPAPKATASAAAPGAGPQ